MKKNAANHTQDSRDLVVRTMIELGLSQASIDVVEVRYSEPHRYYHNFDHIADILQQIDAIQDTLGPIEHRSIRLAAIFHDVIYDPTALDNEEQSIVAMKYCLTNEPQPSVYDIGNLIMATKNHNPISRLEILLCKMDVSGFERGLSTILSNEEKIRKEYQWVDWKTYKEKRITLVLKKFVGHPLLSVIAHQNIRFEMRYLAWLTPKIAVYPGTFHPFHVGHQNILLKAEKIFDKVIVAFGKNPKKESRDTLTFQSRDIEFLKYRQVDQYEGLLTDYIDLLGYPVTVIRGLRNTDDMAYEMTQAFWLRQLKPDINIVNIFCDPEFDNVSSTALHLLRKMAPQTYEEFLVK